MEAMDGLANSHSRGELGAGWGSHRPHSCEGGDRKQEQGAGNQEALLQGFDAGGGGTLPEWRPRQGRLVPDQATGSLGRQDEL